MDCTRQVAAAVLIAVLDPGRLAAQADVPARTSTVVRAHLTVGVRLRVDHVAEPRIVEASSTRTEVEFDVQVSANTAWALALAPVRGGADAQPLAVRNEFGGWETVRGTRPIRVASGRTPVNAHQTKVRMRLEAGMTARDAGDVRLILVPLAGAGDP